MLSSLCSETPVMLLAYSCLTTLWKQRRHLQNSFLNSFGCSFWVLKWPKRLAVKKLWHNFSVPNCNTGGRLGSWKMKLCNWCRVWNWCSDCGIQEVLVGKHLWRLLVQWLAQIKVVTSTRSSQLHFLQPNMENLQGCTSTSPLWTIPRLLPLPQCIFFPLTLSFPSYNLCPLPLVIVSVTAKKSLPLWSLWLPFQFLQSAPISPLRNSHLFTR